MDFYAYCSDSGVNIIGYDKTSLYVKLLFLLNCETFESSTLCRTLAQNFQTQTRRTCSITAA